jgi:hypothetical protein
MESSQQGLYNRRAIEPREVSIQGSRGPAPANLADILERVLDKGIVIAGDIQINLLDIELLTIKLRLLVASVERAQEMGINWWESDPTLSRQARELEEENEDLRARLERLEDMAGLPAPRPGEEVVVETRHEEVIERDEDDGERREEVVDERREDVIEPFGEATKPELAERAARLDIPGRSKMTKDELARAIADEEEADEDEEVVDEEELPDDELEDEELEDEEPVDDEEEFDDEEGLVDEEDLDDEEFEDVDLDDEEPVDDEDELPDHARGNKEVIDGVVVPAGTRIVDEDEELPDDVEEEEELPDDAERKEVIDGVVVPSGTRRGER